MTARDILDRDRAKQEHAAEMKFLRTMRQVAEKNRLDQIELGDGDGNEQIRND